MSTEQILLIVALLVVPLIQSILRAARKEHGDKPTQAESLPSSAHRPPMRELQPPPATEDRIVSHAMTTPERKPAQDADRQVVPPIRRSTRRGTAVIGLRDPLDLRRAIVLMTFIGPCRATRATSPHDWPDSGGNR